MTAANCNELVKIKLVNQEARKNVAATVDMTLTSGKIQNTHPHPEALDIFSLERDVTSFTFRFNSAEEKVGGSSNFGELWPNYTYMSNIKLRDLRLIYQTTHSIIWGECVPRLWP